jgi:hypothetical protein
MSPARPRRRVAGPGRAGSVHRLDRGRDRTAAAAQGYDVDLSCADRACGGFDFRHRIDMGQSPEMHVDIGNFRYLAARNAAEGDTVAVTVSQGGLTLYVHVVHVGDGPARCHMGHAVDPRAANR